MTMQIPDLFIWKKKKYKFVGADDICELFNPTKFGFNPEEIDTACWKGFVIYFIVNENDELILDRLDIHDGDDNYPSVNGVEGYEDRYGYHIYKNINLPLNNYSGTITIADDLKKRFIGRAFIGPHSYNKKYELEIKNGKVIGYKETSGHMNDFSNEDNQDGEKIYYYLTVRYEDYYSEKKYNYISDDTSVGVGDRVLVDMAGEIVIAEVLETAYCNKFEAPFPVHKTKKIIKKVDVDFDIDDIEFYDELDSEITNTIRMSIDDTYFEFGIFNYIESQDNDENWADIKINVHNNNFKYFRKSELMTSAEIERLIKMLEKLLNDELEQKEEIGFYEPDLEFTLYPKINLWDTGKYAYIKEGHEIQDIYMELNINLTDRSGVYTGQKYVMVFDREEVEEIVTYMKTIVNKK